VGPRAVLDAECHKDTKHTDKCRNNKTKTTQKQYDETTDKYFFSKYCEDATKSLTYSIHILYKVHTINSRKKTFAHITSHF
jgi:hypothetical protein